MKHLSLILILLISLVSCQKDGNPPEPQLVTTTIGPGPTVPTGVILPDTFDLRILSFMKIYEDNITNLRDTMLFEYFSCGTFKQYTIINGVKSSSGPNVSNSGYQIIHINGPDAVVDRCISQVDYLTLCTRSNYKIEWCGLESQVNNLPTHLISNVNDTLMSSDISMSTWPSVKDTIIISTFEIL